MAKATYKMFNTAILLLLVEALQNEVLFCLKKI